MKKYIIFFSFIFLFSRIFASGNGSHEIIIPAEISLVSDSMSGDWGRCLYATHTPCANTVVLGASATTNWQIAQRRDCSGLAGSMVQHLVVLQFNTTGIPDSAIIEQAVLGLNVDSIRTNNGMANLHIQSRDMLDASGAPSTYGTDLQVYNDATEGNSYFTGETVDSGNVEIYLNAQGKTDLTNLLSDNWFALALLLDEALAATDTCKIYLKTPEVQQYLKVTYQLPARVTVQTSFDGGNVIIDDTLNTASPYITTWISDDAHTIEVDSVQTPGIGVRYEYRYWSDGGARYHTVYGRDTAQVFTAVFDTFFQVQVNSPYGTATGGGWYSPGTNVNITVVPETVFNADTTIRHIFGGWNGTGSGSYTGTNSSATISVNEFIVEDAIWDTSYYLTINESGVPDTTPYMSGEGWHPADVWVSIFAQDSIFHGGVWYHFDHWTGGTFGDSTSNSDSVYLDYPITITAIYSPDEEIKVFPPESTIVNRGDVIMLPAILTAVVDIDVDSFRFDLVYDTTQLDFDTVENYLIPWSELDYSRIDDTIRVFVNQPAPTSITPPETLFFYKFIIKSDAPYDCTPLDMMNFLYDLSDAGTQPGTVCVRPETVAVVITNDFAAGTVWVDSSPYDAPYSQDWLGGVSHIIAAESLYAPSAGVELRFNSWSDGGTREHSIAPISDSTFTAVYDSFFYLNIISDYGTPSGAGWYLEHTEAMFSVAPETVFEASLLTRHIFDGWEGDYAGTDNPASLWLSAPATETALWHTEHYLALTDSGCGSATPTLTGEGWHNESDTITITADSIAIDGADTFYFVQWLGGDVADQFDYSTTAYIASFDTIIALYGNAPFFVRVFPPESTFAADAPFNMPILIDAPVPLSVSQIYVEVSFDPAALTALAALEASVGWDSISYSILSDRVSVRCYGNLTVSPGDSLFYVRFSPNDLPKTSVHTDNPGDDISAAEIDTGIVFVGVPVTVQILGSDAGLTARIDGFNQLLPYTFEANAWDTIALDCDSVQFVDGSEYTFQRWSDSTISVRARTLVPEGDSTITAIFDMMCSISIITGHCTGDSVSYFSCGSTIDFCVCADSVNEGESYYLFTGWNGTGSGAYTGSDTCVLSFTLSGNIVEEAQWEAHHHLSTAFSGCGSATPTITGDGWYIEGTDAAISATDSVDDGGTWYYFQYWNGPAADRFAASTAVTMDAPYLLTAIYGSSAISEVIDIPDTIFAAPGCYFFIPIIFYGSASIADADVKITYPFYLCGIVDIFSPFDDASFDDHPVDNYAVLYGSGVPVAFSDGDTIFKLLCVARDTISSAAIAIDSLGGDVSSSAGGSSILVVGNSVHLSFLTCADCTLIVNGASYIDSFSAYVPKGTFITVEAPQFQGGISSRKIFDMWSSGAARVNSFIASSDLSDTASYYLQYYVDVNSNYGTANGSNWYNEGDSATISVLPSSIGGDTVRYQFQSWLGEGDGAYLGIDNPSSFSVIGSVTETAQWTRQYLIELQSEGISAPLYGNGFYNEGEWAAISAPVQFDNMYFHHWSGGTFTDSTVHNTQLFVNGHILATAHYVSDFIAPVDDEIVLGGTKCIPVLYHGSGISAQNAQLNIQIPSDILDFINADSCGLFTIGWDTTRVGALIELNAALTSASPLALNEGDTLFCICIGSIDSGNAELSVISTDGDFDGVAGGVATIVSAGTRNVQINGVDGETIYWDGMERAAPFDTLAVFGSTHRIAVPESIVVSGEKFIFDRWQHSGTREQTVLIISDTTFTAIFDTSYFVRVTTAYGEGDGEGWYSNRDSAVVSVAAETLVNDGIRRIFGGWNGTSSSSENPFTFAVVRSETLNALWSTQNYLDIVSDFDAVWGEGFQDEWIVAFAGVTPETLDLSDNIRAIFIGWSGDTTTSANPVGILMNTPKRIVANWKMQYKISIFSERGTASGAGWYDEGDTAIITIEPALIDSTAEIRWHFKNWIGLDTTISDTSFALIVDDAESLSALWEKEYWLDVNDGGHGAATPSGWYPEGDEAIITIDPDTEYIADSIRWAFAGWSGTGEGSYSGESDSAAVYIFEPITETASWKRQFYLAINDSGDASAAPVLEGEGYHSAHDTVPICAQDIVYDGVVRYRFVRWSGGAISDSTQNCTSTILDTAKTFTAHYAAFEVSPEDKITGAVDETLHIPIILYNDALTDIWTAQFALFYPTGLLTYLSVERNPDGIDWSSLSGTPQGDSIVIFASISSVYITPPETLMFVNFIVNGSGAGDMWCAHLSYCLEDAYGGVSGVFVGNPIPVVIQSDAPGTSFVIVDGLWSESPYSTAWFAGEPHNIAVQPSIVISSDEMLTFDNWSDGGERSHTVSISAPDTFTAHFGALYHLTLQTSHSSGFGGNWYPAGDSALFGIGETFVQDGSSRFHFAGWNGTGSGAYTGSEPYAAAVMSEPIDETAQWNAKYFVSLSTPRGVATDEGWYSDGDSAIAKCTPAVIESTQTVRFSFNRWTGTMFSYSNPFKFAVNAPVSLTAQWNIEFYMEVTSEYGTASGGGWYDNGSNAHITISPTVIDSSGIVMLQFAGWTGTIDTSAAEFDMNVSSPGTLTANWSRFVKISAEGVLGTVSGAGFYETGDTALLTVSPETVYVDGARHIFIGWFLSGDTITANPLSIAVGDRPINIVVIWRSEYLLTVDSPYGSVFGGRWFSSGDAAQFGVEPDSIEILPDEAYRKLVRWNGIGSGSYSGAGNPAAAAMNEPIVETALWSRFFKIDVLSDYGAVYGDGYYAEDDTAIFSVSPETVDVAGNRYIFAGWTGDIATLENPASILVDTSLTATVFWDTLHFVDVSYTGCGFAVPAISGNGYYQNDSTATISAQAIVFDGAQRYHFSRWAGTIDTVENPFTFAVLSSESLAAIYSPYEVSPYDTITGNADDTIAIPIILYDTGTVDLDTVEVRVCFDNSVLDYVNLSNSAIVWDELTGTDFGSCVKIFARILAKLTVVPPETLFFINLRVLPSPTQCEIFCDSLAYDISGAETMPAKFVPTLAFSINISTSCACLLYVDGTAEASPYSSNWTGGTVHQVAVPDTVSGAAGERFVFTNWSDGETAANREIFTSSDTNLVANYVRQVAAGIFNFDNFGLPEPPVGTYWLAGTDTLFASAGSPDGESHRWCTGFVGAGSLPDSAVDTISINLSDAGAIFWQWDGMLPLYISSPFGEPSPAGTVWCQSGEIVDATVESTIYISTDSRHHCIGWNASGGISPTDGATNTASVTISDTASLSWQWLDQYQLTIGAVGVGDGTPSLSGDGWFFADSAANITADGEAISSSGTHYFFANWSTTPPGGIFTDEYSPATSITMDNPYSAIASYQRGARLLVIKYPLHSQGWIFANGGTYSGVESLVVWRQIGDTAQIAVSTIDTIDTDSAFIFTGWNFGGVDTARLPITSDFDAVANYSLAYRALLTKIPAENFGTMTVNDTVFSGSASARYDGWWILGTSHDVAASQSDDIAGDRRWNFIGWSDGIGSNERTIVASGPESLSALYLKRFAISVAKNPAENYGSISIGGDVFYADSAMNWAFEDSIVNLIVSGHDIARYCSLYTFIDWADGPTDSVRIITADTSHSLTANYTADTVMLSINVSPNSWNIPDTMWLDETYTMSSGEEIVITNNSTMPVQFGLQMADCDGLSSGYVSGQDKFILRAQFNDGSFPVAFSPSRDFVKGTLLWASGDIFGSGGENISPSDTENMWLQFVSPTGLSSDGSYIFTMTLWARIRLP